MFTALTLHVVVSSGIMVADKPSAMTYSAPLKLFDDTCENTVSTIH